MFRQYVEHGWALCGIDVGSKGPQYKGWNTSPIPADAADGLVGAGLMHALSGTCALDLDYLPSARVWLAERGVDVDALLAADDAVKISSGRPDRAKLLYRMSKPLRTLKPVESGLELRCATGDGKSVQDVLPGTLHPDTGKPYEWQFGILGDWRDLPAIPPALLAAWRAESAALASTVDDTGIAQKVGSVELKRLLKGKSPDTGYDEWLHVGMALHDATGGSAEGLRIWNDWSKPGKSYKNEQDLYIHWVSFTSAPGKAVVTVGSLKKDSVADPEDFEVLPMEAPEITADRKANRAAKKTKLEAALDTLNSRLVYVRESERYFDTKYFKLIGSDNAIEHQFTPLMPRQNGVNMNPVKLLKSSTDKRYVKGMGFHPGVGVLFDYQGETFANSYRPQMIEEIEPMKDELDKINWLFNRIDDENYRKWLLQFLGYVVQHPGEKIKSAPLIWSHIQGNGKTTILKDIPALLVGAQYSTDVSCALLNSDFNDYLLNAWHVNLTEFRAGTRGERAAITSKLKNWITDATVPMHRKGLGAYTMPNHFFVTATSNEDDAAMVDNDDRRWGIHELNAPILTVEEQGAIHTDFLTTERAAGVLRWYFMHVDLNGFSPSAKAPDTEARREMIAVSASSDTMMLEEMFERRESFFARDVVLTGDVAEHVQKTYKFTNSRRIGRMLTRPPFNGKAILFRVGAAVYRGIALRNQRYWKGAHGTQIMAHINGDNSPIDVDGDPLLA